MIRYNAANTYFVIHSYEITNTEVRILLSTGALYIYHRDLLGEKKYHNILRLARQGHGLNSYLNKSCKGCNKRNLKESVTAFFDMFSVTVKEDDTHKKVWMPYLNEMI